jgi:hypothetical protein
MHYPQTVVDDIELGYPELKLEVPTVFIDGPKTATMLSDKLIRGVMRGEYFSIDRIRQLIIEAKTSEIKAGEMTSGLGFKGVNGDASVSLECPAPPSSPSGDGEVDSQVQHSFHKVPEVFLRGLEELRSTLNMRIKALISHLEEDGRVSLLPSARTLYSCDEVLSVLQYLQITTSETPPKLKINIHERVMAREQFVFYDHCDVPAVSWLALPPFKDDKEYVPHFGWPSVMPFMGVAQSTKSFTGSAMDSKLGDSLSINAAMDSKLGDYMSIDAAITDVQAMMSSTGETTLLSSEEADVDMPPA